MIVAKVIKPGRFNADAFQREIARAANEAGKTIKKDFEATTKHWDNKPEFELIVSLEPSPVEVLVSTDDEIYKYVNDGTKPHEIWAGWYTGKSEHKSLVFPSAFTAKTKPNSLQTGPGSSGGALVHTPYVEHKGSKPRNFDKLIKKKRERWFKQQMEDAMARARKASGHAI